MLNFAGVVHNFICFSRLFHLFGISNNARTTHHQHTATYFPKMTLVSLRVAGFLLFCGLSIVEPAKILFLYPMPFPSHYIAYSSLIKELARRGHQITAYTSISGEKSDKNFQHIHINVDMTKVPALDIDPISWRSGITRVGHRIWEHYHIFLERTLESEELRGLMQTNEKFDLLIVEPLMLQESLLAFGHKFNIPVVALFPVFPNHCMAELAGIPYTFSYIPGTFLPYPERMNFWQRTHNAITGMFEIVAFNLYYLPLKERTMRNYFKYPGSESLPPLKQLISNISLHLVNSHQLMSSVRPYTPNVIEIAGINSKTAGILPKDLKIIMDEAAEGVIYVNFGTDFNLLSFSPQFKDVLVETLKGVKQNVIMRWNGTIENAPNIFTNSWLPQLEILAHPNCKLFITHGGFNSLMETMSIGVPTIGVPFLYDQYRNVAWYENTGVGLEVDIDTITVAEFTDKINRVIHTPSFRENARKMAELFWDQPQSILERAVFWVEYVIRHKGAHHLKPASVTMPYYQYLLLDVMVFLAICIFSVVYIVYYLVGKIKALPTDALHVSERKKRI